MIRPGLDMVDLVGKCCPLCWHDAEKPCPDLVACMTEGPLCHSDESCRARKRGAVAAARRDEVARPALFVGTGTCSRSAGADETLAALRTYLSEHKLDADVVAVGCIGLCTAEPIVDVQLPGLARLSFASTTAEKVAQLLDAVLAGRVVSEALLGQYRPAAGQRAWDGLPYIDEHPFLAPQTRWVLANCGVIDPGRIEEYIARGGYRALAGAVGKMTPAELCGLVERSGLRGRLSASPTAGKWRTAMAAPTDQKYLICNADEGDESAVVARALVEGDPHRVLEGMAIAAYAIGASKAIAHIPARHEAAIATFRLAVEQAGALGLVGRNILGSGFNLDVEIGVGQEICGDQAALIRSIEGKPGTPRANAPATAVRGLWGKPTVVHTVETLANVQVAVARGADAYSAVGTAVGKGTRILHLSGKVARAGLVEAPIGTPLRQVVLDIGGGISSKTSGGELKAVQVGGVSGGCIPASEIDVLIDHESLAALGAAMGTGGLVVIDRDTCMVDLVLHLTDLAARRSCGRCIPCREGTRRMLEILRRITRSRAAEKGVEALERFKGVMYLKRLAEVIRDTCTCALGRGAPQAVLSTLRWFRDEYEAHVFERRCPAGVCEFDAQEELAMSAQRGAGQ
ncbi:MAG: NADH-ubiquinone oxidoreductase-F iron-sulfur binding region domain-containing protein [Phycisphaerae bacterium]